ncbi:alpha/beta hydrolase [Heliobacterium chlorum]|uniref:Alpha/beta hydrolase n=1 Tax=Heliobacterium chlorum TaxID=2698 RepID=A0ABR7T1P0_HELCL|nr:alpha/beta hydrolase [Heliobacterium chlorum]MBC9784245.1 alpha/beta hydrolase [Heliobacterium chlorum]
MPSIQARLFRFVLEHRHLLRFQRKRRTHFDFTTSIAEFREDCEKGARLFGKLPEGIDVTPLQINNITAEWIQPSEQPKDKLIVYVHGGGYVSGSCSDHRAIVARIVKSTGITALLFEYRLAPEHPYPAAIDDAVDVYRWLLGQGFSPSNMLIAGESAGGGLALALLLALRDLQIALPAAAVAISPWTDLKCTGDSYRSKNEVSLAPLNSWTVFSKYYAGDKDPTLPWISPLYGELHGLPPLLLNAGEDDELFDDSIAFAKNAKAAGVDVTLRVGERMVHCYPFLPAFIPEARQAMNEIVEFIQGHLAVKK